MKVALQPCQAVAAIIFNSKGGVFSDLGYFGYHWSLNSYESTSNAFSFDMGFNPEFCY